MLIILFFILFVFNSVESDKTEELIYKEIGSNGKFVVRVELGGIGIPI